MDTSTLPEIDFEVDDFGVDNLASLFLRSDRTTLIAGETTRSIATLGSNNLEISTALGTSYLNRATLLWNERPGNNGYLSVTTTIKPCPIDITIDAGDETVTLQDFLLSLLNKKRSQENQLSASRFADLLRSIGYLQPNMVMVTNHPGTTKAQAETLFDLMTSAGATDLTETIPVERRNNIQKVVGFSSGGLRIRSMVIGSMDRSMSTYGNGFENLIGAQVENFRRILANRAARGALEQELNTKKASLSEDDVMNYQQRIRRLRDAGTSWVNAWGGVQEIMRPVEGVGDDGEIRREPSGEYAPTHVPCGDFVVVGPDANEVTIDLWATREERAAESNATSAVDLEDLSAFEV